MKLASLAGIVGLALTACACSSAPPVTPTGTSSAALTSAETSDKSGGGKSAAEQWAEKKAAAEAASVKTAPRETSDPLAMNSELEESSIPSTEITPASQVRAKSPGELNAAVGVVKSETSVDGAAKKLTERLGKPNWSEAPKSAMNAKRRVWVAAAGGQCQRLVLEADGTVEVETASKTEWRMLTASARQNPCTGEIKRGISNR
jgi:hypothetical protein